MLGFTQGLTEAHDADLFCCQRCNVIGRHAVNVEAVAQQSLSTSPAFMCLCKTLCKDEWILCCKAHIDAWRPLRLCWVAFRCHQILVVCLVIINNRAWLPIRNAICAEDSYPGRSGSDTCRACSSTMVMMLVAMDKQGIMILPQPSKTSVTSTHNR